LPLILHIKALQFLSKDYRLKLVASEDAMQRRLIRTVAHEPLALSKPGKVIVPTNEILANL
jgi:hypothetical protein